MGASMTFDIASMAALAGTLKTCYDLGNAAIGLNDSNKLSTAIAQMNKQLLEAQHSLFVLSGQAFALQQQLVQSEEQKRKLEASLEERDRYVLFEVGREQFVYRFKVEQEVAAGPGISQPAHYICQPCFDNGRKVVLRFFDSSTFGPHYTCSVCQAEVSGH